ncbi:poly [ADP-ribose] polymerase [Elysia marginata]|uniref:Poly [ADP-ribose] polymerase n=1 Tax=Elysia marginata TaxID=1093978 RepID=A0AAV4FB04_9GAST|nr:poly [ADP-ribose] polymerase [Elysia marginata]
MSSTRSRSSKRQAAVQNKGDASAFKKGKLSPPTVEGIEVRFEWEGDKSKWVCYSKKFNREIVSAYISGNEEVELTLPNGAKMLVLFDKMVQKNKKTGFERRIRLALKDKKTDVFNVFEWQGDDKLWTPYSVAFSIQLEKAVQAGAKTDTLALKTPAIKYNVDLRKMTQTNAKTKFSRSMRRGQLASDFPPDYEDEEDGDADDDDSVALVKDNDGEETEEKEKKQSKNSKSGGKSGSKNGTKSSVKTLVMKKGSAPVDDQCPLAGKASVYEAGKTIWDCMLNQTNIANNNNKYYLIQLLQQDTSKGFYVWQRWGRVGYNGQTNLVNCGSNLDSAKAAFSKKFKDKTGNDWALKDSFVKIPGKYDLLIMDYNAESQEDQVDAPMPDSDPSQETSVPDSKLDKRLQDLVQLICDVKSMEDAVVEMKYDAKKAPLGKLTKTQIRAGYEALQNIETLIKKKDMGRNLSDACSEFYTRIPHEFGMQTPPLIRTPQMVKEKISLLEALEDIEIAIKMLKGGDMSENPVDRHYHQLRCSLNPLDHSTDDFKLINRYLQETHAATHNQYKMELLELFDCDREGETAAFIDHGNRMLLWHGSRLTNWAGIIGQGLRIAPPEAPVTGYMFGKGVYFADMSSKSANYCFATKTKNTGLLLLCDVSLGTINTKLAADYSADKLPSGKHSVQGLGKVGPDPTTFIKTPDGVTIPVGKSKNTGVNNPSGFTLNYNEFIVYDTCQIRMKYLLKVKFHFK